MPPSYKRRYTNALWMMMEFPITRYLLCNTYGRLNGGEKATVHIELSTVYVASVTLCLPDRAKQAYWNEIRKIHDHTQKLTEYMDEVIGFPVNKEVDDIDYDKFCKRFFKKFLALADEKWESIEAEKLEKEKNQNPKT